MIETKKEELISIDENIINNINILMESIEENNKVEEYKKLLISKDNEISKLNDLNISKENQIKELNNLIEELKKGSTIGELEENFKKEKEQLQSKINNLELEIYNLKEKKEEEIKKEKEKDINAEKEKEREKEKEEEKDLNAEKEKEKEEEEEADVKLQEEEKKEEAKKDEEKKEEEKEEDKEKEKEKEQLNIEENVDNKEQMDTEENKEKSNKLSYEELWKIKQDIEQKNKELVVEIKLLKDNQEPNEINNEDNIKKIEELKNKLLEYETGKTIPEFTQKKLEETESQILELINQNKILTEKINSSSINRKEFETIIFKQENKISELNDLMKKKDLELFNRDHIANKNQIYSPQLLNIINEQKIKIKKIKKQSKEEADSKISELKKEINNLENIVELKETMISNMKNTYKNLQDKYIKMTFNIKRKEQDFFLRQAKLMKNQKKERDNNLSLLYSNKNYSNIFNKKMKIKINDEHNSLSEFRYQNMRLNSNSVTNKKNKNDALEKRFKNSHDVVLPSINMNISENKENEKDLNADGQKSKLEEINEMMKKVIEDENNNKDDD